MKFYRKFFDESEKEEITEEFFTERYKDEFEDVGMFIDYLKSNAGNGKTHPFHFAEYWFEN